MTTPIVTRATAADPCAVCSHGSKGCSATHDDLFLCRGEPRDATMWKRITRTPDAAGFHHYRRVDDATHLNGTYPPAKRRGFPPFVWKPPRRRVRT